MNRIDKNKRINLNIVCIAIAVICFLAALNAGTLSASAAATNYQVWIGGTQITSANCRSNAKWTYDDKTKTLTLNGYTYSGAGHKGTIKASDPEDDDEYYNAAIYANQALNIVLKGTNSVTGTTVADSDYMPVGVFLRRNCTISGSGTLTATGGGKSDGGISAGIYCYEGDVSILSGTVNANGGYEYDTTGIYSENNILIDGGTLNAKGGSIYDGDEDAISCGLYACDLIIKSGKATLTGGNGKGKSNGLAANLAMRGGSLTATGGTADYFSAGVYGDCEPVLMIDGGNAVFTGGTCAKGSYGIYGEPDPEAMDSGTGCLLIHNDAKVTIKGNKASTNISVDFELSEEDFAGGDEEDDEEDQPEDPNEDPYEPDDEEYDGPYDKLGDYYVYEDGYAPVIKVSKNFDGSAATEMKAPDPENDYYSKNKYVYIRKASIPTKIELSKKLFKTGKVNSSCKPEVTYYPENAEIKAVKWTSDNNNVATVSADGEIITRSIGETYVNASIGQASDSCKVVCDPDAYISDIEIQGSEEGVWIHDSGKTRLLQTDITPIKFSNAQLDWSSSDESVVVVDDKGNVRGLKDGKAIITAKDPSGDASGSCTVNVHLTKDVSEMTVSGIEETYEYTGYQVISYDLNVEGLGRWIDYDITYENNVYPGRGKVTIQGKGEYYGTKTIGFDIVLKDSSISNEGTCGTGLTWYITTGGKLLIYGSGDMNDYTGRYTSNEAPWNDYAGQINGIWLENGCTGIGANAFSGLDSLSADYVCLPDSITKIGERAFYGRNRNGLLRWGNLRLPANLKTIGDYAFANNPHINGSLVIPDKVSTLGESAFDSCSGISELKIGAGIRYVASNAFAYCKGLETVTLPANATKIGDNAFRCCEKIREITIPATVTTIRKNAFYKCLGLTEVKFEGNAPTIDENVFKYCSDELVITHKSGTTGWNGAEWADYPVYLEHDHNDNNIVYEPATTKHPGREIHKCSICGITKNTVTFAKIGNIGLNEHSFTYTGEAITPAVLVTDADGKALVAGTDYDVSYLDNTDVGTAKAVITFKGAYAGEEEMTFTIAAVQLDFKKIKLSASSFTYNKKVRRPAVKASGYTTDDYSVKYSSIYSRNLGAYYVTISGKGNYAGTKKYVYRIIPKSTVVSSVKAGKKYATVKWKKQTAKMPKARIDGYQVQYSTVKSFKKGSKYRTVKGFKKTSVKITKLRSKKRYYFRVRTYKTIKGKRYYSAWSKVKTATVK